MPTNNRTSRTGARVFGQVIAVNDPQLMLVVAKPELDIGGRDCIGTLEVRLNAQEKRVPIARFYNVIGRDIDLGEAPQLITC